MSSATLIQAVGLGAFAAAAVAYNVMVMRIEILVQGHDAPQSSPNFLDWKASLHPLRAFELLYGDGIAHVRDLWVTILAWVVRIGLPLSILAALVLLLGAD